VLWRVLTAVGERYRPPDHRPTPRVRSHEGAAHVSGEACRACGWKIYARGTPCTGRPFTRSVVRVGSRKLQ
jgi:hypothetical protein